MPGTFDRHLRIAGTWNLRDLGGYAGRDGETQWRRILRADALHRLQPEGVAQLVAAGLRTVIDLRHLAEREAAPNPFRDHPEVGYIPVPLFDSLAPSALAATAGEGQRDVLLALYCRALAERQGAIRQVLTAIAEAPPGAVLFHCTAGKDRTGIIAALVLAVAGVDTPTILDDYVLTKAAIAPIVDEIVADVVARGRDRASFLPLLACEAATLQATLRHVEEAYGGVDGYLARIGLQAEVVERLRRRLVDVDAAVPSEGA